MLRGTSLPDVLGLNVAKQHGEGNRETDEARARNKASGSRNAKRRARLGEFPNGRQHRITALGKSRSHSGCAAAT